MPLLEHCNIRTLDLDATVAFYKEVVGLGIGPFPGQQGRGNWLYDDAGVPVIHLIAIERDNSETALAEIRERLGELAGPTTLDAVSGGGAVDHIAFQCEDYAATLARLEARGLPYRTMDFAVANLRQLFVNDPSGVTLELNFREGD